MHRRTLVEARSDANAAVVRAATTSADSNDRQRRERGFSILAETHTAEPGVAAAMQCNCTCSEKMLLMVPNVTGGIGHSVHGKDNWRRMIQDGTCVLYLTVLYGPTILPFSSVLSLE